MYKGKKPVIYVLGLLIFLGNILVGTYLFSHSTLSSSQKKITQNVSENNTSAKVTRVIDGDTLEIEGGEKVRYIGINTPELHDPRKKIECFGKEAFEKNKKLVEGKTVTLIKDISETDKYGRLLRYVYVDDLFINGVLVKEGFAYAVSYPPDIAKQDQFLEMQRFAKEQSKGLWKSCEAK